jgi:triosephosphate isomerase
MHDRSDSSKYSSNSRPRGPAILKRIHPTGYDPSGDFTSNNSKTNRVQSPESNKLIVANFKMNFNANQLDDWLESFIGHAKLNGYQQQGIVLCPSDMHIYRAQEFFRQRGLSIKLGSQHALSLKEGALTGEASISMLRGYVEYLIVGHSEQRAYSSPTDAELSGELYEALGYGLKPILCVGEPLDRFRLGSGREFVIAQVRRVLARLNPSQIKNIYIAYEPIWSIGSGKTPNNLQIKSILGSIKSEVSRIIGENDYVFGNILYGGSVNINNIDHLSKIKDINGYLIGSASLDPLQFARIANSLL